MGNGILFQPQLSPGADDTQETKTDLQRRGWASPHCWGVPAQTQPCARGTLCAANPRQRGQSHRKCCQLDSVLPAAPAACQREEEPLIQPLQWVL